MSFPRGIIQRRMLVFKGALLVLAAVVLFGFTGKISDHMKPLTSKEEEKTPAPTVQEKAVLGFQTIAIDTDDGPRDFILYVPRSYTVTDPLPLVFVFHGGGGSAQGMADHLGLNVLADREGFFIAYGNGTATGSSNSRYWNIGSETNNGDNVAKQRGVDDGAYVRAVYDTISSRYSVDAQRVYATGFSLGAMLTYRLACEMTDLFAAVAPVAGTLDQPTCIPSGPLALLHIHGAQDVRVPLNGSTERRGGDGINNWPPVAPGWEFWRSNNECTNEEHVVYDQDGAVCTVYNGCPLGADVERCIIQNHGHAWPGVPPTTRAGLMRVPVNQDFNANEYIWKFFARHTR